MIETHEQIVDCGPDCVASHRLEALANNELRGPERQATLAQVARCAHCSAALKVLRAMRTVPQPAEARAGIQASPGQQPARPRRRQYWLPLVASLALLALTPLLWMAWQKAQVGPQLVRSASTVVEPANGAVLADFPRFWRWPEATAGPYRLRVYNGVGELLQELGSDQAQLEAAPPSELSPGRYVWEVSLVAGGEERLVGSWYFELRP